MFKVAGVSIISNSGAPGAGSTIRIRGGASLSNIRGLGGNVYITTQDNDPQQWIFDTEGRFWAAGNAYLSGNLLTVGPGANTLTLGPVQLKLILCSGNVWLNAPTQITLFAAPGVVPL